MQNVTPATPQIPKTEKTAKRPRLFIRIFDIPNSPSHRRCNLLQYPSEQS
jgi:hypothetical protein